MAKQVQDLPSDLQGTLTEGAQQVFLAALNSAIDNGMDEESAMRVAWTTIEHGFVKGEDGKWHRHDEPANHDKPITTGGN